MHEQIDVGQTLLKRLEGYTGEVHVRSAGRVVFVGDGVVLSLIHI